MITLLRTNSENADFVHLVKCLDQELAIRNGSSNDFYAQYNKIDKIKHVVVAYDNQTPVSCGAIKQFDNLAMEVKRMFTLETYRSKGIASMVLTELEKWAFELNYTKCVLETGTMNPEAMHLYQKRGYKPIPNYGQYIGISESRCFEKIIH